MRNHGLVKSMVAEAAVLPYRVVKAGAADGQVLQSAAAANAHVGVADNLGQDTVAGRVDVVMSGIAEAEAGAAVAFGALLSCDASGRVVTAAGSAGANVRTIGIALAAAAGAGEIIPINVVPGSFQG